MKVIWDYSKQLKDGIYYLQNRKYTYRLKNLILWQHNMSFHPKYTYIVYNLLDELIL